VSTYYDSDDVNESVASERCLNKSRLFPLLGSPALVPTQTRNTHKMLLVLDKYITTTTTQFHNTFCYPFSMSIRKHCMMSI
jgi:hypothetical protein